MKEEQGGSLLLTDQQKQWLNIQKMLTSTSLSTKWSPPEQAWRKPFYRTCIDSPHFDQVMIGIILANILVMLMVGAKPRSQNFLLGAFRAEACLEC